VTRAFAPQLGEHPESYILNVLSVLSWLSLPGLGGYSASKAAAWSLTNTIRQELASQGTRVGALHVGYMDTDLTKGVEGPKSDPADIARIAVDGIAAGEAEILADAISEQVRAGLASGVKALYPDVA
jgi:NAD(P)-dependent dehydrogenase (short-subunit alcohol dehydrogenase family)